MFTVKPPPGGDAAQPAYPSYRLIVLKVPGRRADESYASISELRFLTAQNMPLLCDSLADVAINVTLAGNPAPDAAAASAPNNQLLAYLNLTNTGVNPLALAGLHLPLRFSRGVQAWDGAWSAPPPKSFTVSCWGAYLSDPLILTDPFRARAQPAPKDLCREGALRAEVTDWGVDISFASGILCPGCSVTGAPGGFPVFAVQHATFGALDVGTALAAPPACGAAAPQLPPLPLPGVERHPACAPWAHLNASAPGGGVPACAPPAAVAALKARLTWTYVDAPADVPGAPMQLARELRLRPSITNSGPTAVDLFGARCAPCEAAIRAGR